MPWGKLERERCHRASWILVDGFCEPSTKCFIQKLSALYFPQGFPLCFALSLVLSLALNFVLSLALTIVPSLVKRLALILAENLFCCLANVWNLTLAELRHEAFYTALTISFYGFDYSIPHFI